MPIKTFRGLLGDGATERIRLETLDGKKGYRITKFQLMPYDPSGVDNECIVKIFSIAQTGAPTQYINFSDPTLLAAGFLEGNASSGSLAKQFVIFDYVVFSQDIYVTMEDGQNKTCNYYLELEQISLDDVEATAVILKNFRNTNTT
jgi:hypothetical protein